MPSHPFGWLSLIPPLVAILLAIATRRVVGALLAGVYIGSLILTDGNPIKALEIACEGHLWPSILDPDHLRVFAFTAIMGAMVGVMQRAGGFLAIVQGLTPFARTRRDGQLIVWGLGLILFFDDYANSLLLGNTMRPLIDRLKISRAKLAYLVDSTAAPVSGLALVSTWVAGEIGFIQQGFSNVELAESVDGLQVFIATIPYRFYVLWSLLFVPMVALAGRDLGAMWQAEQAAAAAGSAPPSEFPGTDSTTDAHWWDAVLPIFAVVGVTIWLIVETGSRALEAESVSDPSWLQTFGRGNSYLALMYGASAGLATAILIALGRRTLSFAQVKSSAMSGAQQVAPALVILWLAWTLSGLTGEPHLGTGRYLADVLQGAVDVRWMPTVVFVLASLVAFATGTSWGTMGILMPLVIAATFAMLTEQGNQIGPNEPLLVAAIGSVLAGAIFGDHCSPISDTTVLSSQASGCNHIEHVRTQMPYALLVAAVSVVFGTLPVGFGFSPWVLLPIGVVALFVALQLLGRRTPSAESPV